MQIDSTYARRIQSVFGTEAQQVATDADAVRLKGLEHAQTAAEAKLETLQHERGRLAAKYGPEAPQVALADARLEAQTTTLARAQSDVERAQVTAVEVASGTFVVFGRVTGEDGAGLAGYTIVAVDADGKAKGEGRSAERGAFQIILKSATTRTKAAEKKRSQSAAATTDTTDAAASQGTTLELWLEVRKGRKVVVRSDESVQLLSEGAVYRELVVEGTVARATPTERDSATPSREKGSRRAR